ncbi:16S rRNA (cytosine(967)-C(5))-methyltransferase RsmB [Clostridium swellfunianum]|uniref:16S rRNA (cytosine(967)-C(5))-methyltransferase RsmB n=1 Tax=Clostridium swellfunianum TaxID=1367462 RepID=UPI0020300FB3|nr:16S rRNA (cytosine(967)-C(5))-methyltransferase RsmB [Clostridium swellfunianum]MCM0648727.1 16S rRNA (cytosine(967)-C(5))-methyltransferase RsmB [Clostridium swellfunianum]
MNITRKVAVDIIDTILNKGAYSNIALNSTLNKVNLNDRDKGLVTEIVYGTLKYKYTIDKILSSFLKQKLSKMDGYIVSILRTALYQILFLDKVPEFAAVNEAVDIAKKYKSIQASKFVNAVLRNYLRNKSKVFYDENNKIEAICFKYSYEPWMVKFFVEQYGEEKGELILNGLNSTPGVTVRVNNLKTNFDEAIRKLKDMEYDVKDGVVCPEAIRILKGKSIEKNPLFMEGLITVQDESAMLVAPSMDVIPNIKVLDLCSAPGGKTTHISELMNNTGKVQAYDIHKDKLPLIEQNSKRLGITNIQCDVLDASAYNEALRDSAERVLIDVPCSGLGIIRKKPEIKWTKDLKQLKEIIKIQRNIMGNAAKYVKIGGVLLYSTCTLNKKENEDNVRWFVSNFPNYSIEKLYYGELDNILYDEYGVTILPNEYMDGFFIVKFRRIR